MANKIITVENVDISVTKINEEDYISLTDMLKGKDGHFFITDWLRNRNTLEYLGIWEQIYNPDFNYGEFAIIKSNAGLNSFKISVKELTERTNIIGIRSKAGRYGGTYAHKDLAFEFGMWISPQFKIYLIREFQRLKDIEASGQDWDIKRNLSKINYRIHTDAIKENLIPNLLTKMQINSIYASEADILNVALFGKTAREWKSENKNSKGNIRDYANAAQLVCLSNLENINALLIQEGVPQTARLERLNKIARDQLRILIPDNQVMALESNLSHKFNDQIAATSDKSKHD